MLERGERNGRKERRGKGGRAWDPSKCEELTPLFFAGLAETTVNSSV